MKVYAFQPNTHFHSPIPKLSLPTSKFIKPPTKPSSLKLSTTSHNKYSITTTTTITNQAQQKVLEPSPYKIIPRRAILGAGTSVLLALLLLGFDGEVHSALAFGPEGPMVEEFWDNMRRYGLYALTVSTGVLYAILEPIVELLRNPITAILIITVIVGGGYLVSQVVSAMVGISDFSYNYSY